MNSDKNTYFAYRSFWPEPEAHRRFNEIGVDTVCFFPANTLNTLAEPYAKYPYNWVKHNGTMEGRFDPEPVDAQMADLMESSPNAKFICLIDLNTPVWMSNFTTKCSSYNELGRICSDQRWRNATANYMRQIIEHFEKNYSGQIAAYVLAGGACSEWYDYSNLAESESRSKAWFQDLEKCHLPPADIPGLLARNHVSFDGLLRDPKVDGDALRYIKFCAEQIRDTIKFFLREAKKYISPDIELGIFNGYPLCLADDRVIRGNNDCHELLKCPDLDFVISPNGGFSRIGDGGGDLGPTESAIINGKGYLRECDQRTHSYNSKVAPNTHFGSKCWENEKETLAGLKRELAYTLIKQCSCWWFDMFGGFYDPPAVMELLGKCRKIYSDHINDSVDWIAETALIVDPDSIYYLSQNDSTRVSWFYKNMKKTLDWLGAPYECYYFKDIPDIPNKDRIKLWLLPGVFELTPRKREVLDQYVRRNGQSVLYMYAPGISDGDSLDPKRIKDLCGVEFGAPGVNIKEMSQHKSIYAPSDKELTVSALKEIATQAGVHLYSSHEQPIYANSKFLAVHTAKGGVQTIRLPRKSEEVKELFTDKIVARDCEEFEYELQAPDTALFSY